MSRILMVTETYFPEVGGGETQSRALAEGLVRRGTQVHLVTRRSRPDSARREAIEGVEVHRRGPSGRGQAKKWMLLITLLPALIAQLRRADVAIVCGHRILGLAVVPLCRLFRVPCILKADSQGEHSGAFFHRGLESYGVSADGWAFRSALALRNRVLAGADRYVAISSVIRDECAEVGIEDARILHIPNGVDVAHLRPVDAVEKLALRRQLALPEDGPIVVFTGRLVRYKGLPELIEVWAEIVDRHAGARLVLVGAGGLDIDACEGELRARVAALDLESSVHFSGPVEDVADHLRAADIFVFPSRDEAFGLSPVEAMACGLAVASTHAGGLRDIVRHEETGLVVSAESTSLRDALLRLLEDEPLRERLGVAAREDAVARFSIDSVVERYACAIETLEAS
jgi:glycosyltransferase involved in cell wall biosynthesis